MLPLPAERPATRRTKLSHWHLQTRRASEASIKVASTYHCEARSTTSIGTVLPWQPLDRWGQNGSGCWFVHGDVMILKSSEFSAFCWPVNHVPVPIMMMMMMMMMMVMMMMMMVVMMMMMMMIVSETNQCR